MNRIGTAPVNPNTAFNPGVAPHPNVAGAPQPHGDKRKIQNYKQTPHPPMMQQLLRMIMQLIQMLMQQKGGDTGAAKGAGKAGGAAKARGPAAKGGAAAAKGGGKVDGPNGFLWKPQSESDGKLVTLLPENLRGKVQGVEIQSADGRVLDRGKFSGDQKNGGRPHFRFGKSGAAYGNNVKVVATLNDGKKVAWNVGNGAARND